MKYIPYLIILTAAVYLFFTKNNCSPQNLVYTFQNNIDKKKNEINTENLIICPQGDKEELTKVILNYFKKNEPAINKESSDKSKTISFFIENGKFNKEFVDWYINKYQHIDTDESEFSENYIGQISKSCAKSNSNGQDMQGSCFWEFTKEGKQNSTYLGKAEPAYLKEQAKKN